MTAPSSPDNQRLVSATQTSITMGWSASTDNVGVTGYDVYRNGTKIATTGSSATSYTYSALTCNTTYSVGLVAFDAAGNRSNLAEATGPMSTAACSTPPATGDTTAPTAPSGLSVNNSTATSIGLNWKAATDNVGVTGYGVYRNGSRVSTVNSLTSTVGTLSCGTAYTLGVDAVDAAGNRSTRADTTSTTSACGDTQAPTPVANIVVTARTASSIALSWSASTDNIGVTGYDLYVDGTKASTGVQPNAIAGSLACGRNYTLGVVAFDASGNRSVQSTVMVATTDCADTTPPSAPAAQRLVSATQTSITMGWSASTDNVGVTGYDVYRNGTKIATTGSSATSYTYTALTCNTTYTLGLVAFDAAGNRSNLAQATWDMSTPACSTGSGGASVYLSPSGNDSAACTSASPCKTVERGYATVTSGGVVQMADGFYPCATLSGSKQVTFQAAVGSETVDRLHQHSRQRRRRTKPSAQQRQRTHV